VEQRLHLVTERGVNDVWPAVVVVIVEVRPHSRKSLAVFVVAHARNQLDIFKCDVSFIAIKKLAHRIIRDKNINPSVTVKIIESYAQTFPFRIGDASFETSLKVPSPLLRNSRLAMPLKLSGWQ
jgi:hypothetical protein